MSARSRAEYGSLTELQRYLTRDARSKSGHVPAMVRLYLVGSTTFLHVTWLLSSINVGTLYYSLRPHCNPQGYQSKLEPVRGGP